MKFVTNNDETKVVTKKEEKDQLDIEEIKQPKKVKIEEKPIIRPVKETWKEMMPTTLVNLRKEPNMKSEILTTIKGGETVKVSSSFSHPEFNKVKFKNKDGYISKKYLKSF